MKNVKSKKLKQIIQSPILLCFSLDSKQGLYK